ncbi:MAG: sensor histidine kinase [Bacteroidetes bacterium]|nr:sensor histidine kinase [Bacteroidota bacterium]MBS1755789.1 sensor histidine kinase [Bacteroidota bacterium]
MKKAVSLLLVIILFSTNFSVSAQVLLNRDSLKQKLTTSAEDTNKIKLYYALANQYSKNDLKEAEKYCLLGEKLSRKLHYVQGVLDFYSIYSTILTFRGENDSALSLGLEGIAYAKENASAINIGLCYFNTGIAYMKLERYEEAVDCIENGRDVFIKNNIHQYDGSIASALQLLYHSMHQFRNGVTAGLSAIPLLDKLQNKTPLQEVYNNLGLNYIELNLYDSARYFLGKASALYAQTGETEIEITTFLNYALISLKIQQPDSILHYATKALELSRKYNASEYKGLAQYGLAYYYLLIKDYRKSGLYADSALALANANNMNDLRQKLYAVYSGLYYARQDIKNGYEYFNRYELLSDSMLNETIAKNTIITSRKFETERKENQIKLQQSQLSQKTNLIYFLIAGVISLLIISFLIFRNYSNRQKLQQAKIDELETEKQLTATEAVLKGEEQERTRLAKDLHDGLGGMLSGIKFSLSNMKENLIMTPDNAQAFERSIDMLDSSISEMRRVAHNMMPEILVKYGLDTALKEYCDEIDRSGVLHVNYHSLNMNNTAFEQTTSVAIYRVVQELVNNAIKHAAAKNVLVQLHHLQKEKQLSVTVEDDGNGFDTAILSSAKGIGWSNIQNRVEFLKGKMDIASSPGKGTSVLIELNI